ncbi:MAG: CehA/McbA family metallohydrolase [bacterium]|nr:CehA/McbA family metallohydrolase [bacterium]
MRTVSVDDPAPPGARWGQVRELRADLAATRHPADGGGRAVLVPGEGDASRIEAGGRGHWEIRYEAGPLGVAVGGAIYFMPEPFWGWSPPQHREPRAAGFTRVETDAEGVELELESVRTSREAGILIATIAGRALAPSETIVLHYGASAPGALADRYAERESHLWLAVDGDGDGVRALVPDSPTVEILPGPASRLVITLPSVARPGDQVLLRASVLDALGNAGPECAGRIELSAQPPVPGLPTELELTADAGGIATARFPAPDTGVVRVRARLELTSAAVECESNPMLVDADAARVYWGDLHGHTGLSDGTGTPEDYFRYARDVSGLDVVALTDHDHFGVLFLDAHPELWTGIQEQNAAFHAPGQFVTLLGYEWTSWIHGHRHVLYFDDVGEIHSSLDPAVETPRALWDRLRGRDALTIAHHSSGQPIPVNWTFAPDPTLEPITEIVSVHGSSEAEDSPFPVRGSLRGNYVRDVLERGAHLGFVGSGDSHDGHPGLAHLSPLAGYKPPRAATGERLGTGGLAGIFAPELTRSGVLAAMRARAVYATSGPRIVLACELGGRPMGARVERASIGDGPTLTIDVLGTASIEEVVVIRRGGNRTAIPASGERELHVRHVLQDLTAGEFVYVRVVQRDRGCAWSSPYFVQ